MDIRELYSSEKGNFVIAGAFEHDTQIWDMRDYHKVMNLKTKFSGGGKLILLLKILNRFFQAVDVYLI